MTSDEDLIDRLVASIEAVAGLRPAVPLGLQRDRTRAAVDAGSEGIEIRVAATALPLPPLLEKLAGMVREVLEQTDRPDIPVRVVVTELDADAFREVDSGNRSVT
ncbi:hypothetical protein [Nocardia pseudobrasiliensis]|uniref:Uncharacterized protein n=1 Tax=Nocardia pseudobrasiliensis TaxID=45979 RepID=A0A370IE60_9NOCA|nr:hypothetical protein [Nocardia pseudobrasiliensis]RDI69005.1 hypothetical protein DFR76_101542 [Nocardia pseudobrasiliensis]